MILELPCMDKVFSYAAQCLETRTPLQPFMTMLALWGDPKDKSVPMCHKWGYFKTPLQELLQSAGMKRISFEKPRYHFPFRDMRVECYR